MGDGEKFTVPDGRWVRDAETGTLVPEDKAFNGGTLAYKGGEAITMEQAVKDGFIKKAEPVEDKKQAKPASKGAAKE